MTRWRDLFLDRHLHRLGTSICFSNREGRYAGMQPQTHGRAKLTRMTEGLFGVLFHDQGFHASRSAFGRCAIPILQEITEKNDDPRVALLEAVKFHCFTEPLYRVCDTAQSEEGGSEVECLVCDVRVAVGKGATIQDAECIAARTALNTITEWVHVMPRRHRRREIPDASTPSAREKVGAVTEDAMEDRLRALEDRLGVVINDHHLLVQAVSHRSYDREHRGPNRHNERLEFLGDAVLEWVVTEFLLSKFPEEGWKIERYRSALVSNRRLSMVAAQRLKLQEAILLGVGQRNSVDQKLGSLDKILADAFEALLGAIYLDQGIGACRLVIDAFLHAQLSVIVQEDRMYRTRNAKTGLNNLAQRHGLDPVRYRVLNIEGPDHKQVYRCAAIVREEMVGVGTGKNRKEAEFEAARAGYDVLSQRLGESAT